MAAGIKAGQAWWEITARDSATDVIDRVARRFQAIATWAPIAGAAISASGTAMITPIALAAKRYSDLVDAMNEANIKTGMTIKMLSVLNFASQQEGTNFEEVARALQGLAKFTIALRSGSQTAANALAAMGISIKQFLGMKPEMRFFALADQLSKVADESERSGVAVKFFGRGAQAMMPLIVNGAAGLRQYVMETERLGLAIQNPTKALIEFGDKIEAIRAQIIRVWYGLGNALINAISPLIPLVEEIGAVVIRFVDQNQRLVQVFLGVAAGLVVVGSALTTAGLVYWGIIGSIGTALFLLQIAVGAAEMALFLLQIPFYLVALATSVATMGIISFEAAMGIMIVPIGLAILAITSVVVALGWLTLGFYDAGAASDTMSGQVTAAFDEVVAVAKMSVQGVWDAIVSGNWGLAWQIILSELSLAWEVGVYELKNVWFGFLDLIGQGSLGALQGIYSAFTWFFNKIISGYNAVAQALGIGGIGLLDETSSTLESLQAQLASWVTDKKQTALDDVKRAREELTALAAQAAAKRKEADDEYQKILKQFKLPKFQQVNLDLLKRATGGGPKEASLGTFSATVAGMLGKQIPDALTNVADNTALTNDKLDEVIKKLDEAGPAWE